MSSVSSKYLSVYAATQWRNSLSLPNPANVFLTIGRTEAWPAEPTPPQANTSVNVYYDVWENMIGGKKISGNDVRHCIPRFDWTSGTTYFAYDDLIDSRDLKDGVKQFYVVTDDFNVYKCISNNSGALSTSKPTSINTISDFQTQDGYIWKYMYTISAEEQLRFTTSDYIPVKKLTIDNGSLQWGVQNNAIWGGIHSILITNGGSNYTSNNLSVVITGDGQDANAFAVRNTTSNTIQSIVVDNKGINYTYANVSITSDAGLGATGRVIISPRGGHGSDPLTELGGSNIIINTQLKGTESGKLPVGIDYRQVAIFENPLVYSETDPISNTVVSQLTVVTLSGTSVDYQLDEFVYQGLPGAYTFSGTVVYWDSANNMLYLSNIRGTPSASLLIGQSSTASRFLSSVTYPDMEPYTGNLLYLNNINKIIRSSDQTDDFQIILTF